MTELELLRIDRENWKRIAEHRAGHVEDMDKLMQIIRKERDKYKELVEEYKALLEEKHDDQNSLVC